MRTDFFGWGGGGGGGGVLRVFEEIAHRKTPPSLEDVFALGSRRRLNARLNARLAN